MVAHLDLHVAGQCRAKRALASAVYRHYLGLAARGRDEAGFGPQHVLMLGPTGAGKTLLVRTLAAMLDVPVLLTSATTLVETGYVGDHVETLFAHLLARAGGARARAERGIVFLDEIDKIRAARDGFRDVSGEGVQNALLTVLDGRPVRFRDDGTSSEIDASRVLFIAAGAFVGLEELVRARASGRPALGFRGTPPAGGAGRATDGPAGPVSRSVVPEGATPRDGPTGSSPSAFREVHPQDLVRYGFIPELIGRFPTLTAVEPLAEDDLVRILTEPRDSVVRREREMFEIHGLELVFTEGALRAIAREARARGTGARGLATRVREILQPVTWRLSEIEAEGVRRVEVDETVVAGEAPRLVRGARRGGRAADALRAVALGPPAEAADEERMPPALARQRLRWLRDHALGWEHARPETRAWWEARLQEHFKRPHALLRCAGELTRRKGTLDELHAAARAAECPSPTAWVHMVDVLREKAAWERAADEARRREEARRARAEAAARTLSLPLDAADDAPSRDGPTAPVPPAVGTGDDGTAAA
jgi:ATP-dependent Clp protease ATP-binding subunit ClpX